MKRRKDREYETTIINTKRFENSALPYMTKLLNEDEERKRNMTKFN